MSIKNVVVLGSTGSIGTQALDVISSHPDSFVLLAILVVAAITLYRLGAWKERFFNHDRRVEKIEAIHDTVIELKTKVQLIYDNTNPRAVTRAASPVALTDLGREIAVKIEAKEIFQRYLPVLLDKVNVVCPKSANAYDIQAAAMDIAKKKLPDMASAEEINLIKNEAFARGILAEDIWTIFGIYLRDHILEARGIAVADVDKHDPVNK